VGIPRDFLEAILPVVERGNRDTELPAELGDRKLAGLLSSELEAPPLEALLSVAANEGTSFAP